MFSCWWRCLLLFLALVEYLDQPRRKADGRLNHEALLTEPFLVSLLFGAVTAGVPLLLAGLGEQISEKAGVLNIGIEGMMLVGAYARLCRDLSHGFVLARLSRRRRRRDGRCAHRPLSVHPQGTESDRHRHRHHGGRPRAHLAAAFLPVQPLVSAPAGGAGSRAAWAQTGFRFSAQGCSATMPWYISA